MIFRTVLATVLTITLLAEAVVGDPQPVDLLWAFIAGALWLSLAIDKVERRS